MSHPRIEYLDIRDVWRALGGGPLRGNRGRAFWRDGDGPNVSLNPNKGVWYDQARGEGGGIVKLVQAALGCDKKTGRAWLHDNFGVTIGEEHTPEERREWARRMEAARAAAAELIERRDAAFDVIRAEKRKKLAEYHRLNRAAYEPENPDFALMSEAAEAMEALEALDADGEALLRETDANKLASLLADRMAA